ncbi:hypothetical protein ACIBG5_10735 [Kribbella sp. NPDC050241]|uniref:hypothetical protein n=1 Tax=Kribbella sp. NPDC050241 TaxID=3364115 RepID=UPI0037B3ADE9
MAAERRRHPVAVGDEELLVGLPHRREGDELTDGELVVGVGGGVPLARRVLVPVVAEVAGDKRVDERSGESLRGLGMAGVQRVQGSHREGEVGSDGFGRAALDRGPAVGRDRLSSPAEDLPALAHAVGTDQRLRDVGARHTVERDAVGHDDRLHGLEPQILDRAQVRRVEVRVHRLERRREVLEQGGLLLGESRADLRHDVQRLRDAAEVDVPADLLGDPAEVRLGQRDVLEGVGGDDARHLLLPRRLGLEHRLDRVGEHLLPCLDPSHGGEVSEHGLRECERREVDLRDQRLLDSRHRATEVLRLFGSELDALLVSIVADGLLHAIVGHRCSCGATFTISASNVFFPRG